MPKCKQWLIAAGECLNFYYETLAERKDYIYQLAKLIKAFNFLSSFYNYSEDIE